VKFDDVVESALMNDTHKFNHVAKQFRIEQEQCGKKLLEIFKNPRSSNFNRCSAAYYLGELRFAAAANDLAADISLNLDMTRIKIKDLPLVSGRPAMDALIMIGIPSVPAIIQNLASSVDEEVRKRSAHVLIEIEGDPEIAKFILRRAVAKQSDKEKQARLNDAMEAIASGSYK
jgi:hypothetical protein